MEIFSPVHDELIPTSDTSTPVLVIGELHLKPPVNVVGVCAFLQQKPNDHPLFVLHPAVKNLNVPRHSHDSGSLLSRCKSPALVFGRHTVLAVKYCMRVCLEVSG
jgi:hypothetical protein